MPAYLKTSVNICYHNYFALYFNYPQHEDLDFCEFKGDKAIEDSQEQMRELTSISNVMTEVIRRE